MDCSKDFFVGEVAQALRLAVEYVICILLLILKKYCRDYGMYQIDRKLVLKRFFLCEKLVADLVELA